MTFVAQTWLLVRTQPCIVSLKLLMLLWAQHTPIKEHLLWRSWAGTAGKMFFWFYSFLSVTSYFYCVFLYLRIIGSQVHAYCFYSYTSYNGCLPIQYLFVIFLWFFIYLDTLLWSLLWHLKRILCLSQKLHQPLTGEINFVINWNRQALAPSLCPFHTSIRISLTTLHFFFL